MPKFPKLPNFSQIVDMIKNPSSAIEKTSSKLSLDSLVLARKILTTPRYSGTAKISKAELISIVEPNVLLENNLDKNSEVKQIQNGVASIMNSPIAPEYLSSLDIYEALILENTLEPDHNKVSKLIRAIRNELTKS